MGPSSSYGEEIVKMINELIATPEPIIPKESEHWAESSYRFLTEEKGIKINERRFDDTATRGEVFAILARALGLK